ncbi:hypothetical protein MKW94_000431 [Papaver nudicaule]|uniref:Chlororespiratory reduction 3 n=1 Tax=Papaver nudicaule TaxID=74823 RepID=A0AA41V5L9_PAPNU|nr:hypothetical protein [Papaver nudicaule]
MVSLRCSSSVITNSIFASLPTSNNNNNVTKRSPGSSVPTQGKTKQQGLKGIKQQPSVAEVEKAIGAGMYRNRDSKETGEKTLFDKILTNPFGEEEGPVEQKLRETGEWILETTEGPTRSAGQQIFVILVTWVLPVWVLCLLVACGFVKLPFDVPLLDDLLM